MVVLRYRKDRKLWQVDYRRRGVRFRSHFHSQKNARDFRRKIEDLIERERVGLNFVEPITFEDFSKLFVENHFKEKASLYKINADHLIRDHFLPLFGNKLMTEITFDDVSNWKEKRALDRISPKTLRDNIFMLSLLFKAAIKNGYATLNPVDDIELPKNIPSKKRSAVQDDILRKALRAVTGEELFLILILRNTGMRLSELFRVDASDIDFENRLIRIKSVTDATTKNYESRFTILTPTVTEILRKLHPNEKGFFGISQRAFTERIRKLKKNLQYNWDLHSLRHSFTTKLRNANVPERIVAHYLGHSQKTETDRYTSYTPEFINKAIHAADFGSEFLHQAENVVTLRSPKKITSLENNGLNMGATGFEPALPYKINHLEKSSKNPKNKVNWKKV